ncbi:MAG: metallophosphoesterase [Chloroflexi bacterium]|nr:metallophosphoesterase [Chloroflexota bacterium]
MSRHMTRRQFLKTIAVSTLATTSVGGASLVYATEVEPRDVAIEHVSLKIARLDPAFDGYKLVQISDLHLDYTWMSEERLLNHMRLVNEQKPDAVAITGDFVTDQAEPHADSIVKALQMLNPRDNTVAVLGNHDHWTNASIVQQAIQKGGISDVNNGVYTVRRGEAMLHLCGVNDIWEGYHRLDLVMDALPDEGAAVLLAHEPDYADVSSQTGRFDLQLSGHSHGGQVQVPFIGPIALPYMAHKYPSGLYKVNGMVQYTNRGLGMVAPQVRFNCRPEITVFTLESEDKSQDTE